MTKSKCPKNYTLDTREKLRRRHVTQASQELRYIDNMGIDYKLVLLDFSLTVKAAPHECVIRTSQP